ncbi:MAG TPA: permease prefix domain 1-containing protein [Terriglobia bacterium]|jgi:ABC-type lipoprotein release transport system permease subunit
MWSDILYRLRCLFFRKKVEQEMADELEFHLQHEIETRVRSGMDPEAARRQAIILSPLTFVLAAVVLLAASLFGAFVPAYRASRTNPAATLRTD